MTRRTLSVSAVLLLAASTASAQRFDNCRYEAQRNAVVRAGPGDRLDIRAGSGSLSVVGKEGLTEMRVVGRACASHERYLEELTLTAERQGSTLRLETHHPEWRPMRPLTGNNYARIDLVVEVPAGLSGEIEDSSGELDLEGLGSLTVQDGSGGLRIARSGSVRIEDSSGEIDLRDIDGDVDIEDGSGEIDIRGVRGSVTIRDGSGEITAEGVAGSVTVRDDGSGHISVDDVGGDFVVMDDGSGGISHRGVKGKVDIPRRRRG